MEYKVVIGWDEENKVFYVVESDIQGLWLEAASVEALVLAVKDAAPDLVRRNHEGPAGGLVRFYKDTGQSVVLDYAA